MFKEWLEKNVLEFQNGEGDNIVIPFYPIHDHAIDITVERKESGVRIHDGGETIGTLFMSGSLVIHGQCPEGGIKRIIDSDFVIKEQNEYIKRVLEFHDVKVSEDNDVLWMECKEEDLGETMMNFIQAIIQVYSIAIW